MARLPKPGADPGKWANLLNEYLLVAHNPDGTQRGGTVATVNGEGPIKLGDLDTSNAPRNNLVLSNDGTNLVWKKAGVALRATQKTTISVADYGAKGDGVTDDTDAIQAAIDAAGNGGSVEFVHGCYMVRTLKVEKSGTALVGAARLGTCLVRISGDAPLIDISGRSTREGHIRYCTLTNLMLKGNGLPGALVRSYYADTCLYSDIAFTNTNGVATDLVEVWDTRFYNCSWEACGSLSEPAMLLRNSTAKGTFGHSEDNTNQIHFLGCRWESYRNGALRLEGNANGSTSLLNGIFLVSCKMESSTAAGPSMQIMGGTTLVCVNQLYVAIMGRDSSYSSSIDAVIDNGTQTFLNNVYVQWGAATGLANSAIRAVRGDTHVYNQISAYYPDQPPAVATVVSDDASSGVSVGSVSANCGKKISGNMRLRLESDSDLGLSIKLKSGASFRLISTTTDKDIFKADNSSDRPTLHTVNGADLAGFSDDYSSEKWRFYGDTGFVRLASGKFQVEGTKGYLGIGIFPYTNIGILIKQATDTDRGLAIVRHSATGSGRMMEFQDEAYNIQGQAFDFNGRPIAVGSPPNVAKGEQVSYANPRTRVQDIAGNITAAVIPSPTSPGTIAVVTFSRLYQDVPLAIAINDHSATASDLYVSARSTTGFTVSTRSALRAGSILNFDYTVTA